MLAYQKLTLLIILCLSTIFLSACDNGGLSSEVDFKVYPSSPIIINVDDKAVDQNTGDVIDIKAPWFSFGYYFKNNNNSETLNVVNMKITVTNFSGGAITEDVTELDLAVICSSGSARNFLATVGPGEEWREDGDCDNSWDGTSDLRWQIHGLSEADSFTYTVEMEPQAYFTDATGLEISRYDAVQFLITQ